MKAPNKIYLSKLVMAGAETLDKPVSDDDVEYIRADAIRNEIERLKAKYRKDMYKSNYEGLASGYKIEAYNELLSFLSTLESEKPMNLEDFDKALDNECKRYFNSMTPEQFLNTPNTNVARHFAEWGAKHLRH